MYDFIKKSKMINWLEKQNKFCWLTTILIAITIFYLSSITFEPGTGSFSIKSYFYHFFAFFFLATFLLISILQGKLNKKFLILAGIIAVLYGVSDEIHQLFVPGRYFSFLDILTNSIGILTANIIYFIILIKKNSDKLSIIKKRVC